MKMVHVANFPMPAHTPILNELARLVNLHVIYMSRPHSPAKKDSSWHDFEDAWGSTPEFDHSFFWSWVIGSAKTDLCVQFSLGVGHRLRQLAPDVVFCNGWGPLTLGPLVWTKAHRRKALMWAESTSLSGLARGTVSNLLRARVLSQFHAFVSNGTKATEYLMELGIDPRLIVTSRRPSRISSPDTIHSRMNGPEGNGPRFLFAGRLVERKQPLSAIDAFEAVRRRLPRASLAIVGDGPLMPEVSSRARVIGDSVRVLGRVEGEALDSVYDEHDILVMPALREVWGLVVNEALARGMFVVATDQVGSAWDLVQKNTGLLVPAGKPAALADAMEQASLVPQDVDARRSRAMTVEGCTPAGFARDIKRAADIALGGRAASS